ncbi:MAG: hypothetical protein FJ304_22490, partial [Planctomycetes bacterium]|nr:hypothetical protein [Planctomycetota bacterium]
MRRWRLLNRLLRAPRPRDRDRCILVVEQLEAREVLSPVVVAPSSIQTLEDVSAAFSASAAFFVFEDSEGNFGQNYVATLAATNGVLSVDESTAISLNVSVANNGTAAVTLTGQVEDLTSLLISPGITFAPTSFFSGEASVAVTLTDPLSGESDTASALVRVSPVASNAFVAFNASDEVWAPASGFAFPPGFLSVQNWPDADGSKRVTVIIQLDADSLDGFALSANGVPITPDEPGQWRVSATTPDALAALLDSLVLTPPAGFTGRATLFAFGNTRDEATFTSAPTTEADTSGLGGTGAFLRFFRGGSATTPTAFGQEGNSIDLGGRYVASAPDEIDGDTHTLTLSVTSGALGFDTGAATAGLGVGGNATSVTLVGTVAAINAFLATAGSVTFTPPDENFSGTVPLTITLTNQPGKRFFDEGQGEGSISGPGGPGGSRNLGTDAPSAFSGTALVSVVPVADRVFPSAADATTTQDQPVALAVALSALVDTDGSESVLVLIEGVPAGATFDRGTDLGGGQWAFAPADLPGLTFTPPPGATGTFALVVKVIVTDAAPGLPSDSATEADEFTVTVTADVLPPDFDDPDEVFEDDAPVSETDFDEVEFEDDEESEDAGPVGDEEPEIFGAYTGATTNSLVGGQSQVGANDVPAGTVSFFAPAEPPVPSYGAGEKHPLPPVLPLDQTLPVAGFSESGGDSIALVDKLYRDATVAVAPPTVSFAPAEAVPDEAAPRAALALVVEPPA